MNTKQTPEYVAVEALQRYLSIAHLPFKGQKGIQNANAERIVLCLNFHDELLSALDDMVSAFEHYPTPKDLYRLEIVKIARATISKVKSES